MSFQLVKPAYAASDAVSACWAAQSKEGVATIGGIECIITSVVEILPRIVALAAVGVIIIAGMRLMSAGSDPKAVASAWQSFTWALIGIVLLSVIWLVLIIIENVTGAPVTQFGFPS